MATKKKKDKNPTSGIDRELSMLDRAAKSIFSIIDPSYVDKQVLSSKDQKIRSILDRELEISKGVSNGSIIDFVSSVQTKQNTNKMTGGANLSPNSNELFTQNINDVFGYFQDIYKNRFIEISDLKFIAKFIPALGEAVKTMLDAIVASDNVAETVNRSIELPSSVSEEQRDEIINEIKRNEKELKLLKKLKNTVYKKSLVTGNHYVYAVSYNKIFSEYDKIKKQMAAAATNQKSTQFGVPGKTVKKSATESFMLGDVDISDAMENVRNILGSCVKDDGNKMSTSNINDIMDTCKNEMPIITCNQSIILEDALESAMDVYDCEIAMEALTAKDRKNGKNMNNPFSNSILDMPLPDGTKGTKSIRASKFNVSGTYIKYIDSKNILPVKVFDQTVGYFLVHPKAKKNKNSAGMTSGITSIGSTLFGSTKVSEDRQHNAIERIADSISEGILNNFNTKFVTKNSEYKKMIADCIIANGLTDKDYNIQFIPAEDIIEFTVNENDEGFGESVLTDSLFPAKLLLTTIVCRLLNYVNKTGNKTIAHVYKGPVNAFTSNQINRVIRDLQDQNITFNDLLSPNLVFNKFNRDGNIAIPTSKNGNRLVEFETQEGQNIDMSPEYEKELEKMAILGTGVPDVIMEYAGSADFAKQLVSANIKFAGRISTLQADLEEPTTELYKKICENSNMSDECKAICSQNLEIKLPRPRVLVNGNNGDYVRTIVETAEAVADVVLGRDSVSNPEVMKNGAVIKEKVMYEIVRENTPFMDWDNIDDIVEKVIAQYAIDPTKSGDGSDDMGGMGSNDINGDMSGGMNDMGGGNDMDMGNMDMGEDSGGSQPENTSDSDASFGDTDIL